MQKLDIDRLKKIVKMTGERARIDAKINNSYIVYQNEKGIVKEYTDGKVVIMNGDREENE